MKRGQIEVVRKRVDDIRALREEYRRAMDCQIVHDSYHERGFTDSYLLKVDGEVVGYASLTGSPDPPREIVRELYVRPEHSHFAQSLFRAVLAVTRPRWIEAQTNDPFLMPLLVEFAKTTEKDRILFSDASATVLCVPDVIFRPIGRLEKRRVFSHKVEPVGDWVLDLGGTVVATGGLMFHYNPPFADLYMEVAGEHQRRGYGSFLVQELKRICRETGYRAAARCNIDNLASQRTLERAGMMVCGHIVRGALDRLAVSEQLQSVPHQGNR
ncbi:MAG: GNAT family N-acetyltransferase [Gemmatimonadota bacterium]